MACRHVILVLLVAFSTMLKAQVVQKGNPRLIQKKSFLEEGIPTFHLPSFDVETYRKTLPANNRKRLHFARMFEVDLNMREDGKRIETPQGDVYVLAIHSQGAYSLSVVFGTYHLPPGAELYIYNPSFSHVKGAMTHRNNKITRQLPVEPVRGEKIIVEYFEPDDHPFDGALEVSRVGHDFLDVFKYLQEKNTGVGTSGDCNVNINCPEGQNWQDVKHAVAKIITNGWLCSGSLINTSNFDGKPYLLTANHCIKTESEAQNSVFYFDFESPECDSSYVEDYGSLAVANLLSTAPEEKLDFTLVGLSDTIPIDYQPYYAGWNIDTNSISQTTTIHHPSGDVKKISKDFDPPLHGNFGDTYDPNSHWLIEQWDVGTTEGGSSGAPLFDQNQRIIGDLTGGEASCDYNFNDYFAKLSRSWDDFSDTSSQLKVWLDPNQTSFTFVQGYFPYQKTPSNLRALYDSNVVLIKWNPSVEYQDEIKYEVFRDNKFIGETAKRQFETVAPNDTVSFYKVRALMRDSTYSFFSDSAAVFPSASLVLPVEESFETQDSLPYGWYNYTLVGDSSWRFQQGGENNVPSTASDGVWNISFNGNEGDSARLVTSKVNLAENTFVHLSFDLSMPSSSGKTDRLNVFIRYADSLPWHEIHTYTQTLENWNRKEMLLPNPTAVYMVAFEAVSQGGGGVNLDNVRIEADSVAPEKPELIVEPADICNDQSVEFSLDTPDVFTSYSWSFGYGAVPYTLNGYGPHSVSYNFYGSKDIVLILNDRYEFTYSNALEVYEVPDPSIIVKGDELISNYQSGNQWFFDGQPIQGADSAVFSVLDDGNYFVKVTNEHGCIGYSDTILVTGIQPSDDGEAPVLIYPNPANEQIHISAKAPLNDLIYVLYDIQGKAIREGKINLNEGTARLSISDLEEGIYVIRLFSGEIGFIHRKIMKKD